MQIPPDTPEWLKPAVHAVILAMAARGNPGNMRAAVIHSLERMPPGELWIAPPELLDRIEPREAHPVWPNVTRDPTWLRDALGDAAIGLEFDADKMPSRLVIRRRHTPRARC